MLFAPLAFFLPETMPFLDTDLQTKSDEELASLKVALADLPVPLLSRFMAVLPPAAYSTNIHDYKFKTLENHYY